MRGFTFLELLVVLVVFAIIAMLLTVSQPHGRAAARRAACANNLSQIGKALIMYSDVPSYATFPTDTRGARGHPLPSLGILYGDYVTDYRVFSCPAKSTVNELKSLGRTVGATPSPNPLNATMTHYGYDPGNKGTGFKPHSPADTMTVVAADFTAAGANSDNHGPNAGQNVLLAVGSVEWRDGIANSDAGSKDPRVDPDITADSGITDPRWSSLESFISQ